MNNNMTAVEWLENQIKNSKHYYSLMKELNSRSTIVQSNIFEQAKEMHKQEIIDSYNTGYLDSECNHINDADQHYHQLTQKG